MAVERHVIPWRAQAVFLNEERVVPTATDAQGAWYLDTGPAAI